MSTSTGAAAPTADEKRRKLAEMLARKAAAPRVYPVSFLQQRIWFLDRLDPESTAYNFALAFKLRGALDLEALNRALNDLHARHDTLRTRIRLREGEAEPVQEVLPHQPGRWEPVSVEHLATAEAREAERDRLLRENVNRRFELAEGALLRFVLVRLAPDEHALGMAMHHIVMDGWSQGILARELNALYGAHARGETPALEALPIQYGDFSRWQREFFQGEELQRQLAWWRERLEGAPAVLELPTDRPRQVAPDPRARNVKLEVEEDIRSGVAALARQEGATAFMVLLAAFYVVLHRWTGQDDLVVGTPIAGRTRRELEGIFGYFANTLALRTQLQPDLPFRQLVRRVRELMVGAYAHQEFPFEKLVDELKVERSLATNPLFQVMFALQNATTLDPAMGDLDASWLETPLEQTVFDLTFQVAESGDGYALMADYRSALFDEDTVARLQRHFRRVLAGAAERPDTPVADLPLMEDDEEEALRAAAAAPAAAYPERCLHELFEEVAAARPGATALVFGDDEVTYGELNARANRLARRLRALGAGVESRVAFALERGPEQMVAILACMKAGAAYVPVDPAYPAERRRYLLDDSGASVLVTSAALTAEVGADGIPTVVVDDETERWRLAAESSGDLGLPLTPDHLAYVIYTSGSTGRPKGVLVPHRGVVNLAVAELAEFGLTERDRVLQFASLSFDSSVFEWAPAFLAGAAVVMGTREELMPGPALADLLRRARVTMAVCTPTALALVPSEGLPELRIVTSGGEACTAEVAERWAPGRQFYNAYGPTEITVVSNLLRIHDGSRRPPVGPPLPNLSSYVLDPGLRLCPRGVPGELCIGGVGVTRGYHGRPALTAERFAPDPFSATPGARLYRTGDRVRRLDDGTLEFLGRLDEQVKIRGFRIEPGEVETALREVPGVSDAVVVVREDRAGDPRLVAYVVGEQAPDAPTLRLRMAERLPEPLVPAAFVHLPAIPVSAHGKLDRAALPAPDAPQTGADFVAPRTPTEERVAAIWCEVLGLERVGVNDSFFALGGHSLLATQVVTRVGAATGVEPSLRTLFESPTVAGLAAAVDEEQARRDAQGAPAAPAGPTLGAVSRDAYRMRRVVGGDGAPSLRKE